MPLPAEGVVVRILDIHGGPNSHRPEWLETTLVLDGMVRARSGDQVRVVPVRQDKGAATKLERIAAILQTWYPEFWWDNEYVTSSRAACFAIRDILHEPEGA